MVKNLKILKKMKEEKEIKYKQKKLLELSDVNLDFLVKDFEEMVNLIKKIKNLEKK